MGTHRRISQITLTDIFPALADLAAPGICVCCAEPSREPVCDKCRADFPYTRYWEYDENPMAEAYNLNLSKWIRNYEPYAHACALFRYDPLSGGGKQDRGYAAITRELKYFRAFGLGRRFGSMLGTRLRESAAYSDVDTVVPVPLHWARRMSRGYNQSEIIARAVAAELGAECRTDLLRRIRRTKSQTTMSAAEKSSNVAGAFKALPGAVPKHILLVDDVFTTGSTLSGCHEALRALYPYPIRISAATLACVK